MLTDNLHGQCYEEEEEEEKEEEEDSYGKTNANFT